MAATQPYLQFRVYEQPGLAAADGTAVYQDSYPRASESAPDGAPAAPARGNGSRYTYNPNRTPDWYLKSGSPATIYDAVTDDIAVSANHFSATKRANDISTWSATFKYHEDDSRAGDLWEACQSDTSLAVMHVTDPEDDQDVVEAYMAADLFDGRIFSAFADEPQLSTAIDFPGPIQRGFSGPVLRRSAKRSKDILEITVQGASVGKFLQQSVQSNTAGLSVAERTGLAGFQRLARSLLSENAEYDVPLLDAADLAAESTAQGTRNWKFPYNQAELTATGLGRTRTPIAYAGIVSAFSPQATGYFGRQGRNDQVFALEEGQHSIMRAYQRLAESAGGLLFDCDMAAVLWYSARSPVREWHPEDYVEAVLNNDRPEATAWLTKHNDWRRDWLVYVIASDLISRIGEIQVSNQSTAPRALSEAAEIGATFEETNEILLRAIQAQDAGLALYEAAKFSATVGGYWDYPFRFGKDIGMGTEIDLYLSDRIKSDENMDLRQAACVWANSNWSWSYGLGSRAILAPKQRADDVYIGG